MLDSFFLEILTALKANEKKLTGNKLYSGLVEALESFINGNKELIEKEKDRKLDTADFDKLSQLYGTFIDRASDFISSDVATKKEMAEIMPLLDSALIPARKYHDAVKNPEGRTSLKKILDNKSWIDDLFTEDKREEIKNPVNNDPGKYETNISAYSNIKRYAELFSKQKEKLISHFQIVSGSKTNPAGYLSAKTRLIRSVLLSDGISREEAKKILKDPGAALLSKEFRFRIPNHNKADSDLEAIGNIKTENREYVIRAMNRVSFNPKIAGITENDLKELNDTSKNVFVFGEFVNEIKSNFLTELSQNEPLMAAYFAADQMSKSILSFVQNNNSQLPEEKALTGYYVKVLKTVYSLVDNNGFINDYGKASPLYSTCYKHLKKLEETFPRLEALGRSVTIRQIKQDIAGKINAKYSGYILDIAEPDNNVGPGGSDPKKSGGIRQNTKRSLEKIEALSPLGLPKAYTEKAYYMSLVADKGLRDTEFRKACKVVSHYLDEGKIPEDAGFLGEMEAESDEAVYGNALKTLMSVSFIREEEQKAAAHRNAAKASGLESWNMLYIRHGYNTDISSITSGDINFDDVERCLEILPKALSCDKVHKILNMGRAEFKSRLGNSKIEDFFKGNLSRTVFKGDVNLLSEMDPNVLDVLIQNEGGKKAGNSDWYNLMAKAVMRTSMAENSPGGASYEDYRNLYSNLMSYINTHDSNPFRTYGKNRFNACAKLLYQVGNYIAEKNPEAKAQVEKDFRVCMLRSKVFRTYINEDISTRKTKNEKLSPFRENTANILKQAEAGLKAANLQMVTGILNTPEKRNALLDRFGFQPRTAEKDFEFPENIITDISEMNQREIAHGQMSQRLKLDIKLENGKNVKGFFTKNESSDMTGKIKDVLSKSGEILDNASKDLSKADKPSMQERENFVAFFNELKEVNPGFLLSALSKAYDFTKPKEAGEKIQNAGPAQFNDFLERLDEAVKKPGTFSKYENLIKAGNPQNVAGKDAIKEAFTELVSSACNLASVMKMNVGTAKIEKGGQINIRNNAMADAAKLFGTPDLICRSVKMSVIENGKQTEGTYMVNAKGLSIDDMEVGVKVNGRMLPLVMTAQAKRDFGRMQILDYLCANIDRHGGNFFYQTKFVSDADGGHIELTGIQGIDNDMSFGAITGDGEENISRMSMLGNIPLIDREQAEMIIETKAEDFEKIMRSAGLSKKEVEAGLTRFNNLRSKLLKNEIPMVDGLAGWEIVDISDKIRHKQDIWSKAIETLNCFGSRNKTPLSLEEYQKTLQPEVKQSFEVLNEDAYAHLKSQLTYIKTLYGKISKPDLINKENPAYKEIREMLGTLVNSASSFIPDSNAKNIIPKTKEEKKAAGINRIENKLNYINEGLKVISDYSKEYLKTPENGDKQDQPAIDERVHLLKNLIVACDKGRFAVQDAVAASWARMMKSMTELKNQQNIGQNLK